MTATTAVRVWIMDRVDAFILAACICWVVLRWLKGLDIWGFGQRPLLNYARLTCAVLSYGIAVHAIIEENWLSTVLYSLWAVMDFWDWWNDEESRRKRKKLWDKVKRRVRQTATGRLGVSET